MSVALGIRVLTRGCHLLRWKVLPLRTWCKNRGGTGAEAAVEREDRGGLEDCSQLDRVFSLLQAPYGAVHHQGRWSPHCFPGAPSLLVFH
jgi:hypothetical protein